jgi:hypothetical protein
MKAILVERKGGKYEMIGFLMILLSLGGCSAGLVYSAPGFSLVNVGLFFVGIVVFIYGRFF